MWNNNAVASAIAELKRQDRELGKAIEVLTQLTSTSRLSPEGRNRISASVKQRWEKFREEQARRVRA